MFGFLRRSSVTEAKPEGMPPSPSHGGSDNSNQPSSFSFMSGDTSHQTEVPPANSGFSFMQSPAQHETPTDTAGHSSFSFMAETSQNQSNPAAQSSFSFMAEQNSQPPSSFSFMSSPEPAQPPSSFSFMSESTPQPQSSFSFMSESSPAPTAKVDNLSSSDLLSANDSQDLKLNKTAAAKAVKKKKKVARVGTGRDDGGNDDEQPTALRRGSANELEIPDPYSGSAGGYQTEFHQPAMVPYDTAVSSSNTYVETVHWNVQASMPLPEVVENVISAPVTTDVTTDGGELPPPPPMYRPETPPNDIHTVDNAAPESADSLVDTTSPEETAQESVKSTSSFVDDFYAGMQHTTAAPMEPEQSIADVIVSNPQVQYVTSDVRRFDFLHPEQSNPSADTTTTATSATSPTAGSSVDPGITGFSIPSNFNTDLQFVNDKLLSCITNLRINYETAYRSQEYLLQEFHQNQKHSLETIERISLLESKQETYAKQEEFEQAELLSNEIAQLQKELSNSTLTKNLFLNKLQKLQDDYSRSKALLVDDITRFLSTLTIHCAETSQKIDKFLNQLQSHQEEEELRISIEEQRVSLERNQHQREEDSLQQESRIIEDAIATQVGDLYDKRSTISEQLSTVQDEIRILEEQLALKRNHEQELSKSLKSVEFKITDIRKKYDRQLVRINERKEILQKVTNECDQEMALILQTKKELNEQVTESEALINDTEDFISLKMKEKNILATVLDDLQTKEVSSDAVTLSSLGLESSWEVYVLVQTTDTIGKSANMTSTIQQQIDQMTNDLAKSKGHVNDLRIQYDFYYQKVHSLSEEVEKLELQKKLYASNKKFKEAATTAKELKDAMEHKESMSEQLKDVKNTLHKEENAHEELEKQLAQLQRVFEEQQKQEKLIHIHRLHQRIQEIRRLIQQLSSKKYLTRKLRRAMKRGENIDMNAWNTMLSNVMKTLYEEELQKLVLSREDLCLTCDTDIPVDDELPPLVEEESDEEDDETMTLSSKKNKNAAPASVVTVVEEESGNFINEEEEDLPPVVSSLPPAAPPSSSSAFLDFDIPAPIVDSADYDILSAYDQSSSHQEHVEEETAVESEPVAEEVPEIVEEEVVTPQISVEDLQSKVAELEAEMETAAESEDYDRAAALMDEINALKEQLESLSA